MKQEIIYTEHYALIVSDSEPINMGDSIYDLVGKEIHSANDEWDNDTHFEWAKVLAHRPLKDAPIIQGVPLLPEFSQEDEVEDLALVYSSSKECVNPEAYSDKQVGLLHGFIDGYNKAKSTYEFTLENMRECWNKAFMEGMSLDDEIHDTLFFDNFIQSLKVKRPKYFECEMQQLNNKHGASYATKTLYRSKTITNPKGQIEVIGEYIYG